ncbi:MAG: hypothetical protein NUW37_13150 [Planctomycetes bacterium]|nr:hypothetical protein [Planctomycetota bacterium]
MGHRCNLVIVENDDWRLYYSHWGAINLARETFWGPKFARQFVEMQNPEKKDRGWLDTTSSEGSVLLDFDKKIFLIEAGDQELGDLPRRKFYLDLVRCVWKGWKVRWPPRGCVDVGAYVGRKADHSRNPPTMHFEIARMLMKLPQSNKYHTWKKETGEYLIVASFRLKDGTLRYMPFPSMLDSYLAYGPELIASVKIENMTTAKHLRTLMGKRFPAGGIHFEMAKKTVHYWSESKMIYDDEFPHMWHGWKLRCHFDDFEKHEKLIDNEIEFPRMPRKEMVKTLREMLLAVDDYNPAEAIFGLLEMGAKAGLKPQVSREALENEKLDLPGEMKERILDKALADLEKKQKSM